MESNTRRTISCRKVGEWVHGKYLYVGWSGDEIKSTPEHFLYKGLQDDQSDELHMSDGPMSRRSVRRNIWCSHFLVDVSFNRDFDFH